MLLFVLFGCTDNAEPVVDDWTVGDPVAGYDALVNNGYVSCGIPDALSNFIPMGGPGDRIDGRNEQNQDMPYFWTKITAESGVDLVVANCLTCHASRFNGELIVGLGDVYQDYTEDTESLFAMTTALSDLMTTRENQELEKFVTRASGIAEYTKTKTAGANPAISITAGIMEHLDPVTLQWSEEPIIDVPDSYKNEIMGQSVPPWWWYKKKDSMFYSASGGGSHVAWSMLASSMCIENEQQAQSIADYFPDILAYIRSIESPEYPWTIDQQLAQTGEQVFLDNCSSCHGTYGENWTYDNTVVALADIGTDPVLANMMYDADIFHQWVDDSFFGLESMATPELGYVAPPLDGVWATAPYLHNGSVPTIEAVLNSSLRPDCWTWSYDSRDYNQDTLGWNHQESPCHAELTEQSAISKTYDHSHVGYGTGGHTYGDHLSNEQRTQLIEYLKTL